LDRPVHHNLSDILKYNVNEARKINHLLYYDRAGFGIL
jgi:hypothetical protein